MLTVIVMFHEAGHFVTARTLNVNVTNFSIGFGPELFGFTYNGIRYKVCMIPLGGYVEIPDILEIPWYKSAIIALAGPLANFILFYLTFFIVVYIVNFHTSSFLEIFHFTNSGCVQIIDNVLHISTKDMELSGPIGMVSQVATSKGWLDYYNQFMSINLSIGVLNLLPIPPLDGFAIFSSLLEPLFGKEKTNKFKTAATIVGTLALIVFMVYITGKDIVHLFK